MNKNNKVFWITFVVSLALIITGFFIPPMGIIDGSVITAVGLLLGFSVVYQIPNIVNSKSDIKIKHNDTEIEVNNPD